MQNSGSIEESLLETIARSDLKDACADLGEVVLDAVMEDGILKDIPVIGTLAKLTSAVGTVRDRLLAKKLLLFIREMGSVSEQMRREQIDDLASSPKERQRVGEQLILLLERLDNMQKPALLARAFQALLEKRIDHSEFSGLARAIDDINAANLPKFKEEYERTEFFNPSQSKDETTQYYQCGLLTLRLAEIDTTARFSDGHSTTKQAAGRFALSHLGRLFYEVLLKTPQTGA